jgi:hypothetical protein
MITAMVAPVEAAPISAAMVVARAPVDAAIITVAAVITAAIITAAVITAAVVGRAIIPAGVERRDITGGRVDAGLITTGQRDRERCDDCAQKNATANHGFSPLRASSRPSPLRLAAARRPTLAPDVRSWINVEPAGV